MSAMDLRAAVELAKEHRNLTTNMTVIDCDVLESLLAAAEQSAAREAQLRYAGMIALAKAKSWIHDQLDGTSSLEGALAELAPVAAVLAPAKSDLELAGNGMGLR